MDHFLLQLTFTNFSDTPEGFDMNDLKDFSSHQKLLVKVGKSFAERAKQEPDIADKIIRIVKEADRRGLFTAVAN